MAPMHPIRPQHAEQPGVATPGGYFLAVAVPALAIAVAAFAERWLGLDDLSLVFMMAVLVVAARTSTGPAVLAAVLCFLAYNFFFIEPRFTFYIAARHGVTTVLLFLAAALLAGRLASRLAMQVQALRAANAHANALQDLGRRLATAANAEAVVQAAHEVFRHSLDADVWVRVGDQHLHPQGVEPPPASALRRGGAGEFKETIEEFGWWFLPLRAPGETLGVIGLKLPASPTQLDEAQRRLARTMTDDIAQAIVRIRLVDALESERVASETERLRAALLSSVSHDLRSPLASIIGSASSLESYGEAMPVEDRRSLLETIRVEGERLDRYIQNLLDMTRLGHGGLAINRDWIGIDELIGAAVSRLQHYQPDARFETSIADSPPIWVHPALVEQALFNVIENAAKFSPPGEAVSIATQDIEGGAVRIDVRDRGPGIPEDERKRIFDMFYSVARGDRGRHGTGLGLAITQGMIGAHGGSVEALPGDDGRGTTIRITLPRIEPSPPHTP